jgi:hypothetical protein
MRSVFSLIVVCGLAAAPGHMARAQEQTIEFQVIAHTTTVHALPAPGRADHSIGVAEFHGLAILTDGQIAQHSYSGTFDFIKGSGQIRGYALWAFEDGSRLEASYVGQATAAANGGITFTAKYNNVRGSGRYAGVRGDGMYQGRRVQFIDKGGDTYFRGTLKLSK